MSAMSRMVPSMPPPMYMSLSSGFVVNSDYSSQLGSPSARWRTQDPISHAADGQCPQDRVETMSKSMSSADEKAVAAPAESAGASM